MQTGSVYTLDGYDDQCGASQRAPLVGLATQNPDATIGLGFHIVTVPGGKTVSVETRISLETLSGPWTDSAGNSGTLVFNGVGSGSPRPLPTSGPAWGSTLVGPSGLAGDQRGFMVTIPTPAPGARGGALVGTWGNDPPSPDGDDRAGVLGLSRSAEGVIGKSGSGIGVLGTSESGAALYGSSMTGSGMQASSDLGTAIRAFSGAGAALELQSGPIKVSGSAGRRPVFAHTTTPANITANASTIDHPLLNGNATAVVFITHAYVPGATVLNPHPVAVYYDAALARWRVLNEDGAAMPANVRFSVLVVHASP